MAKRAKVVMGWYCVRCNKRIPDAQCGYRRAIYGGTCNHCADEYVNIGMIAIHLPIGRSQVHIEFRQCADKEVYPVITA